MDHPTPAGCPGRLSIVVGLTAVILAGAILLAEGRSGEGARGTQTFQSRVDLVHVTVTVTNADGRLVPGLPREAFRVLENGRERSITYFSQGRVPVSLGIVLDISDSMFGQRITDAKLALKRFLGELLESGDEAFLLVFNHRPQLVASWTMPPETLGNRLGAVKPFGGTAIYDAMVEAIPMLQSRTYQRAALVLISDGADTASDKSVRSVSTLLRQTDGMVYAIAIDASHPRPINDPVNPYALQTMTDESGGYTEIVLDSADLGPATSRIAEELNQQYTLGYDAALPLDGSYRRIKVEVDGEDLRVRARRGYVATPVTETAKGGFAGGTASSIDGRVIPRAWSTALDAPAPPPAGSWPTRP